MAINNDSHLIDSKGNVAIDFVWGNFPLQPNDDRDTQPILNTALYGTNLNFALSNHVRAETGWNGYPQYLPNTTGTYVGGVPFTIVPVLVGDTLATALDNISDAGLVVGTQTTITNTPIAYTVVTRTAGSFDATITAAAGVALCPVGAQIVVTGTVAGTFTVKSVSSTNLITFTTGASTVLSAGTGTVAGVTGTIQAQSVAAGAASIALGTTINITPYA
jgi:hypothetical protein